MSSTTTTATTATHVPSYEVDPSSLVRYSDRVSEVDELVKLPMCDVIRESFLDALTTAVAHAVCAPPPFNTAGALKTLAVMDVVYQVIGAEHPPSPGHKRKSPVFGAIDVLIATTYFRRIRNSERAVALLRRDTNALLCERLAVGALLLAIKARHDHNITMTSLAGALPRPFRNPKDLNRILREFWELLDYGAIVSNSELRALHAELLTRARSANAAEEALRQAKASGSLFTTAEKTHRLAAPETREIEDATERVAVSGAMQLMYPEDEDEAADEDDRMVDGGEIADEDGEVDMDTSDADDDYSSTGSSPAVPTPLHASVTHPTQATTTSFSAAAAAAYPPAPAAAYSYSYGYGHSYPQQHQQPPHAAAWRPADEYERARANFYAADAPQQQRHRAAAAPADSPRYSPSSPAASASPRYVPQSPRWDAPSSPKYVPWSPSDDARSPPAHVAARPVRAIPPPPEPPVVGGLYGQARWTQSQSQSSQSPYEYGHAWRSSMPAQWGQPAVWGGMGLFPYHPPAPARAARP